MAKSQKDIWDAFVPTQTQWDENPACFFTRRANHINQFVRQTVPVCRSLEVGCGGGRLLEHLLRSGYEAYACDISDGMVAAARARIAGIIEDPTSRVRVSREDELPFDGRFRLVAAIGVFPCVADHAGFLGMLSGALESEGTICAQCANRFSLYTFAQVVRALLHLDCRTASNLVRTGVWSGGNVDRATARQCHSARSFDRLFASFGYERVAAFGMFGFPPWDKEPLARTRLGSWLVRHLGWSYIGMYRKRKPNQSR